MESDLCCDCAHSPRFEEVKKSYLEGYFSQTIPKNRTFLVVNSIDEAGGMVDCWQTGLQTLIGGIGLALGCGNSQQELDGILSCFVVLILIQYYYS